VQERSREALADWRRSTRRTRCAAGPLAASKKKKKLALRETTDALLGKKLGLSPLYSEDFQHNRAYGTVRVVNPFHSLPDNGTAGTARNRSS